MFGWHVCNKPFHIIKYLIDNAGGAMFQKHHVIVYKLAHMAYTAQLLPTQPYQSPHGLQVHACSKQSFQFRLLNHNG
eukprot:jgi/Chrzof1/6402/Cz18g09100.t1